VRGRGRQVLESAQLLGEPAPDGGSVELRAGSASVRRVTIPSVRCVAALVSCVGLFTASAAHAQILEFGGDADCAQAAAGAGTCLAGGQGVASISATLDVQSNLFSWNVQWSGLSGEVTVMHFHGAAGPTESAPPVLDIGALQGLTSPNVGSATVTAQQAADIASGLWYLNIHTSTFPSEEIRGQLLFAPSTIELRGAASCNQSLADGICLIGARGSANISATLDFDTGEFAWDVVWRGLSSPVTVIHFHGPAGPGQSAPPVLDIGSLGGLVSPNSGSAIVSADEASDIASGLWYLNVHTLAFPQEEIRGQLLPVPTRIELSATADCSQAAAGAGTCEAGAQGTASVEATLDLQTDVFAWDVQWSGLSNPATVVHFHGPAGPTESAPVALNIGVLEGLVSPNFGRRIVTAQQAQEIAAGLWYLNIHTSAFPQEEIRGQLPEPTSPALAASAALVLALLARARRRLARVARGPAPDPR